MVTDGVTPKGRSLFDKFLQNRLRRLAGAEVFGFARCVRPLEFDFFEIEAERIRRDCAAASLPRSAVAADEYVLQRVGEVLLLFRSLLTDKQLGSFDMLAGCSGLHQIG